METVLGEPPRQGVDLVLIHRGQRHHSTNSLLLVQDPVDVAHRPENLDTTTTTEVIVADEPHHLVAELRLTFVGVHQTNSMRIGADDHDPTRDLSRGTQLGEHPARNSTFDHHRQRHRQSEQHHPQPRQLAVLDQKRRSQQGGDARPDRLHDVPRLLPYAFVGSGQVQPVQPCRESEGRQRHEDQTELLVSEVLRHRPQEHLGLERHDDRHRDRQRIRQHQPALQPKHRQHFLTHRQW